MSLYFVSLGESAQNDVCVGSVSRPGGAQPICCLETTGHLRLKHRADPLRLCDTHNKHSPRKRMRWPSAVPGAGWEGARERKTYRWLNVGHGFTSLHKHCGVMLFNAIGASLCLLRHLLWIQPLFEYLSYSRPFLELPLEGSSSPMTSNPKFLKQLEYSHSWLLKEK